MHILYDSVNAAAIQGGMVATAGYVDGNWANSAAMRAAHPNLPHVSIAVFARHDADALDCEPGDATVYEAPGWADRQYARGVTLPIIYTSASNIAELRRVMGGRNFLLWSAHYTYNAHVCGSCGYPGADATQFADKGPNGENVDLTLMSDAFYVAIGGASSLPAPSPHAPAHAPAPAPHAPPTQKGPPPMFFVTQQTRGDWLFGAGFTHHLNGTEWGAINNPLVTSVLPTVALEDGPVGITRFDQLRAACLVNNNT